MGHIVPDAVEHYLAAPEPCRPTRSWCDIAREGRDQGLPIVDAEVGALLRVLALRPSVRAHPRNRHGHRLLGHLAGRRAARRRHADDDGAAAGSRGAWRAGNFARAGLADRASVMVGDASLLVAKVAGPFDLVFQDGDKALYSRCSTAW